MSYETEKENSLVPELVETKAVLDTDQINSAYLRLIESTLDFMKIKYSKPHLIASFVNNEVEELNKDKDALSSIHLKKFSAYIRISATSPFNRNIIELMLLPISRSIFLEEEQLYLSPLETQNFINYRSFIENDNVREACIVYVFSVLKSSQDSVINSQSTFKSFQEDTVIVDLLNKWKQDSLTLPERHTLLAIFINLVLFEVIQNNRKKRSKFKIVNFLIDKLAKPANNRN